MKTYTIESGVGEGRRIDVLIYSATYLARDFLDAVSEAKRLMKARIVDPRESAFRLSEVESSLVWAPSIEFLRR